MRAEEGDVHLEDDFLRGLECTQEVAHVHERPVLALLLFALEVVPAEFDELLAMRDHARRVVLDEAGGQLQ